jgi:hypothetical protein
MSRFQISAATPNVLRILLIFPESLKTDIGMVPNIDHDDILSHVFNLWTNGLQTATDLFNFISDLINSGVVSLDYIALNDDGTVSG